MIFVVDSDQNVFRSLAKLVEAEGLAITAYSSGEDFYSSAIPDTGDIVVLDLEIVGLSGAEFKEFIHRRQIASRTIITSTRGYPEAPKLAKQLGAIGYFSKPVDRVALIDLIRFEQCDGGRRDLY